MGKRLFITAIIVGAMIGGGQLTKYTTKPGDVVSPKPVAAAAMVPTKDEIAQLRAATVLVQSAGYNCPAVAGISHEPASIYGKELRAICGTGQFRITLRPNGSAYVRPQ